MGEQMRVLCLVLVLLGAPLVAQDSRPTSKPNSNRLGVVVKTLASDAYGGRGGAEKEKSRKFIAASMRSSGLVPVGEDFRQKFDASGLSGVNIVGRLVSKHPKKRPGHLILSAHYDHLGRRGGKIYHGACDNASGVAALLHLAATIKPESIRRDILFIAFDLEERGLLGSYAYADHPLLPLSDCLHFVTMDMLGRPALDLLNNRVFVSGWEWTPEVLPILAKGADKEKLEFRYFWTDIGGDRSDFVAFRKKRIPHLFFTVGENEDYHRPSDTADKIDLVLLKRQAGSVRSVLVNIANREQSFVYRQVPDLNVIEFTSLKEMAMSLAKSSDKKVTSDLRAQAMFLASFANKVVARGKVTSKDRATLKRATKAMQRALR